jgi:hypothetical protein
VYVHGLLVGDELDPSLDLRERYYLCDGFGRISRLQLTSGILFDMRREDGLLRR